MTVLETERKNLKTLSDEELVKAAQSGNNEALEAILSRYKNLVYAKSKPYFLAGADDDDIIQEGLIGLYKAVMDFDGNRFPFFKVFAGVCVTRQAGSTFNFSSVIGTSVPKIDANITTANRLIETE